MRALSFGAHLWIWFFFFMLPLISSGAVFLRYHWTLSLCLRDALWQAPHHAARHQHVLTYLSASWNRILARALTALGFCATRRILAWRSLWPMFAMQKTLRRRSFSSHLSPTNRIVFFGEQLPSWIFRDLYGSCHVVGLIHQCKGLIPVGFLYYVWSVALSLFFFSCAFVMCDTHIYLCVISFAFSFTRTKISVNQSKKKTWHPNLQLQKRRERIFFFYAAGLFGTLLAWLTSLWMMLSRMHPSNGLERLRGSVNI